MKLLIFIHVNLVILGSLAQTKKCKNCNKYGENVVCANDGKSWFNMQCMAACSSYDKVKVISEGKCIDHDIVSASEMQEKERNSETFITINQSNKKGFVLKRGKFDSCRNCNRFTDTTVVCGSDGISWLNRYCMDACSYHEDVSIVHTGKCNEDDQVIPKKRKRLPEVYDSDATQECKECKDYGNDKVCGSDGVSWMNKQCMYACSSIKDRVKVLHKGTCKEFYELFPYEGEDEPSVGKPEHIFIKDRGEACKTCNKYGYDVVCASDRNSWRNEQCMRGCSDKEDVKVVHKGWCKGQG